MVLRFRHPLKIFYTERVLRSKGICARIFLSTLYVLLAPLSILLKTPLFIYEVVSSVPCQLICFILVRHLRIKPHARCGKGEIAVQVNERPTDPDAGNARLNGRANNLNTKLVAGADDIRC